MDDSAASGTDFPDDDGLLPWEEPGAPVRRSAILAPNHTAPSEIVPPGPSLPAWQPPAAGSLDIDLEDEIPWVIGPCIAPGDCVYFVGLDSEGKTTLVADIVEGALLGPEFDDDEGNGITLAGAWRINREYIPHGSKALVLNGETTGATSWARKLAGVALSRGLVPFSDEEREIRSRVDFLNGDDVDLRREVLKQDATAFGDWCGAVGYKLVVIDPVFNFFDPEDNADSTWVNRGLRPLVISLKARGITTLCIAHPSSLAMQRGRRGGPRLQQVYTPFGSNQQKYVQDARFGVTRVDSNQQQVEILKLKDRRETDAWIPKVSSRIRCNFASGGAGYTSYTLHGSGWETFDPTGGVVLGEAPRKLLAKLPGDSFEKEHLDDLGITKKVWAPNRDKFFLPQQIITSEVLPKPGGPLRYHWTNKGLRARDQARRDFPYEIPKESEDDNGTDAE